jgi:hypothetical protein
MPSNTFPSKTRFLKSLYEGLSLFFASCFSLCSKFEGMNGNERERFLEEAEEDLLEEKEEV